MNTEFLNALRCVPPQVLHGVMAAAVLCTLASSAIGTVVQGPGNAGVKAPLALFVDAPVPAVEAGCPGCGFVESIQRYEAEGLVPAGYLFTVRMLDGSTRTSIDPTAGTWLVGERILLIGGSRVPVN
jgi:hypothetical protein